jgi:hypothetical protein
MVEVEVLAVAPESARAAARSAAVIIWIMDVVLSGKGWGGVKFP